MPRITTLHRWERKRVGRSICWLPFTLQTTILIIVLVVLGSGKGRLQKWLGAVSRSRAEPWQTSSGWCNTFSGSVGITVIADLDTPPTASGPPAGGMSENLTNGKLFLIGKDQGYIFRHFDKSVQTSPGRLRWSN